MIFLYAFFGIFSLFLIVLFVYGEFLTRRGDAKTGFTLSSFSARVLSTLLIIILIFFLMDLYFKEDKEEIKEILEFPESPAYGFPPAPEYIEIGGYYFNGPWPVRERTSVSVDTIFTILCKQEDHYLTLGLDIQRMSSLLRSDHQYSCWVENCRNGSIYYATLYTVEEEREEEDFFQFDFKREIIENIRRKINFICN